MKIRICMILLVGLAAPATARSDAADPPFEGVIATTAAESRPAWPRRPAAPEGAPNIVVILLDDIGFAETSVFGGLAQTPALRAFADGGVVYNNFNVTAMCSPTRAALLTGRNHHRVGFGVITEGANGFPGYDSYWSESTAPVARVLHDNGYRTAAFGKWHNTPDWEITTAGPFDRWPTGFGFDYFYGFMGAEDDHWNPNRLYRGTVPVVLPERSEGSDYHLTADLVDDAIGWLRDQRSLGPEQPFFLYFATGATHTPHHAPPEWIEPYRGKFDRGWDVLRAEVFERQKQLGVVPGDAMLTPRPPQIPAWDSLSVDERRLYARQMEVYAGFVAHTDHQIGRLLREVEKGPGASDNTLVFYVVGDNGALAAPRSSYGAVLGLEDELARIERLGSAEVPFNSYAGGWGWLGNTPFKYWKTVASHFGGLRVPLVVSWPGRTRESGVIRSDFRHVTDIVPTIYEVIGIEPPQSVGGVAQEPMDGASMLASFTDPRAASNHKVQYFELSDSLAIYDRGWMASRINPYYADEARAGEWELYHVARDFTQANDLAASHPEKLRELVDLFDREAKANRVYPIGGAAWRQELKPFAAMNASSFEFLQGRGRIPWAQLPSFNRSHSLEADLIVPEAPAQGLLASFGFSNRGFAWYVLDGRLVYENRVGAEVQHLRSARRLPPGRVRVRYEFECRNCPANGQSREPITGRARMFIEDELVAQQDDFAVDLRNGGEALSFHLGRAGGSRITDAFDAPFPFTGSIDALRVHVD